MLNFDGAGNITGTYTFVGIAPTAVTGSLTGTYSDNQDGTANADIVLDVGGGSEVTATLVTTDGGNGFLILLTGGPALDPSAVVTGTGRIQSVAPPAGSYGYVLNQWPDANSIAVASLGVVGLDGAGNLNVSYAVMPSPSGPITGTVTGTYKMSPDGSITATVGSGASAFTIAMVVTDGGSGLLMLVSGGPIFGNGTGTVVSGTARLQ